MRLMRKAIAPVISLLLALAITGVILWLVPLLV